MFRDDREYLVNEFENAIFREDTGVSLEEIDRYIDRKLEEEDRPFMLRKGEMILYFLSSTRIAVNPHSIFPCIMNAGVRYGNEAGAAVLERVYHTRYEKVLNKALPDLMYKKYLAWIRGISNAMPDFWHDLPDWEAILRLGLKGLLDRAESCSRYPVNSTPEKQVFFRMVRDALNGILIYCERCAELCEKNGLLMQAENYRFIRSHPPENTYQAMLVINTYLECLETGVERGRSLGRLDQLLYPYYVKDLENGPGEEGVRDLFRYFFTRFSAARRKASQPFTIGGTLEDGSDACNALTGLMLDVYRELDIRNPKIHIRYHKGLSGKILGTALELIRSGDSAIMLISDDAVIAGYKRIGIPEKEAARYIPVGCYEPVIPGLEDAMICASWTNLSKAAELVMYGGHDPEKEQPHLLETPLDFDSYDGFLQAFYQQLDAIVLWDIAAIEAQLPYRMEINPSPIYSASFASCMERGRDVFDGGMKYSNVTLKLCGIGTAVDSLLAVKELVFDRHEVTLGEMREALKNNWNGYESLRRHALSLKNKFGNGIPEADRLAAEIYGHLAQLFVGKPTSRGGVYRMGCDSITFSIVYGKCMGATPDGRRAGEPFSKNFSPSLGMEREGITAFMRSVCTLDSSDFVGSGIMDFTLHPSAVSGEKGLEALKNLILYYFSHGGFAIQGNVLSADTLLRAREEPDKYRNLQVRLCGWNEYFVDMDPAMQEIMIKRLQGSEKA